MKDIHTRHPKKLVLVHPHIHLQSFYSAIINKNGNNSRVFFFFCGLQNVSKEGGARWVEGRQRGGGGHNLSHSHTG